MPEKKVIRPDWFDKAFVKSHGDLLREMVFEIVGNSISWDYFSNHFPSFSRHNKKGLSSLS